MRSFQARRLMGGSILLLLAIAVGIMLRVGNVSLYRTAFLSGWLLLALVVFLASYNGRKKLTYPPWAAARRGCSCTSTAGCSAW